MIPETPVPVAPEVRYSEHRVTCSDGSAIFVRRWTPAQGPTKAELLVIHGYFEHGGRYREFAHHLATRGIATTAPDLRGHGHSDGQRGYLERFAAYHDDVQAAVTLLGEAPHFFLGHSNGGLVVLDFVVMRRPQLHGVLLTNPFVAMTRPPNRGKSLIAGFFGICHPSVSLPAGVDPTTLSHDPNCTAAYARDPLVFKVANTGWWRETRRAQQRVRAYRALEVPLFYCYSDSDPVASPTANRALAEQLACPDKTVEVRHGELHEVLHETKRDELHQAIAAWISARI